MSNIDNATAAGLKVGIYFYSEDNNTDDVRDHARWIAGLLAGRKLDFPIAFDWEDFEHFQSYGMSIDDLNELYEAFADELSLYGLDTMLYSSKNFLEFFWTNDYHRPVWLAHYVDQTDYAGEYKIWQRCYGKIAGINADTDFNILYK
jgi:GH25 family lysozyme M1 (1,4-beta-N-acetylmuramidase)